MHTYPDALWLNTNPSFRRFDQLLVHHLSCHLPIGQWEYSQSSDEPTSLDIALTLLHDYLKSASKPIHLMGHSTGGLLGLLYARKHPERVKSLTLLGVGVHPAVDWQIHYYTLRELLPCSQEIILSQMVKLLFGYQSNYETKSLAQLLKQDLATSPSSHSLYQRSRITSGGVSMPLMICGGKDDLIISGSDLQAWKAWLKKGDRLWECSQGNHFFHFFYPRQVGKQILNFWQAIASLEKEHLEASLVS